MHAAQVLALLLAASAALNIAFAAGLIARQAGASISRVILTAAGAASTAMALYLTAVSAYH
jgi:hypothetical protein